MTQGPTIPNERQKQTQEKKRPRKEIKQVEAKQKAQLKTQEEKKIKWRKNDHSIEEQNNLQQQNQTKK